MENETGRSVNFRIDRNSNALESSRVTFCYANDQNACSDSCMSGKYGEL